VGVVEDDQVLVDQGADALQRVPDLSGTTAHPFGRAQVPAAGEDRQAAEELRLSQVKQVVAPRHRVTYRALALRQVEGTADQQPEPVPKLIPHRGQRQVPDPGRSQLDSQRQAIELAADFRHRHGGRKVERQVWPDRQRAFPEQRCSRPPGKPLRGNLLHLARQFQGRNRELLLTAQPQRAAAGDQEGRLGRAEHEGIHQRSCRRQVLEGVQHDQGTPARQPLRQQRLEVCPSIRHTERFGQLRPDEGGIFEVAQGDEVDAAERLPCLPGGFGGQPGLPYATRSGQRQQPDSVPRKNGGDGPQLA
jgi:hypothetical protein